MPNVSYLNAGQHTDMAVLIHGSIPDGTKRKRTLSACQPTGSVAAAIHALDEIDGVVSDGRFTHPGHLTQDTILAYALALLRVRVCAGRAKMRRLMNACDALAVTVSRLIEDHTSASQEKCEALRQFVVHAREMIHTSAS